ncbi:hypothetical protein F5880DRAFT_1512002 [Lentinula raphanica]|nr:hypothetical protein F5880DRAFT_1512002 [Lentinula raphanica]
MASSFDNFQRERLSIGLLTVTKAFQIMCQVDITGTARELLQRDVDGVDGVKSLSTQVRQRPGEKIPRKSKLKFVEVIQQLSLYDSDDSDEEEEEEGAGHKSTDEDDDNDEPGDGFIAHIASSKHHAGSSHRAKTGKRKTRDSSKEDHRHRGSVSRPESARITDSHTRKKKKSESSKDGEQRYRLPIKKSKSSRVSKVNQRLHK